MTVWQSLKKALGLPTEPEKLAWEAFPRQHPGKRLMWSTLAAEENDRFVVGVFYDEGVIPPSYEFLAVSKINREVTPVDDDSAYRPKVWR